MIACRPTCHIDRLGEDVVLCTACAIVFLDEVGVRHGVALCGGREEDVHARGEHAPEILRDQTPNLLSLHKVTLVVPKHNRRSHSLQLPGFGTPDRSALKGLEFRTPDC